MKPLRTLGLLAAAAALWLPSLHLLHRPDREAVTTALVGRAASADGLVKMRAVNPEWDFMTRTYTVLGLANRAIAKPEERAELLVTIDAVIDATLAEDAAHGDHHFMLPYAKRGPFVDPEARSLFVDGEIVAMIAARDLVEPRARSTRRTEAEVRAARIVRSMRKSPTLSGESYPDECWTFCNTTALAGLAMLDRATGSDHGDLTRDWIAFAKTRLVDPRTGILVSSYTYDGRTIDGPEGSSIWMTASNLLVLDEAFAKDQYARARRELGASFLGFGWAREWPSTGPSRPDVDSGPVVPILEASAGSSGLALLGASAFRDEPYLASLLASVDLAAFRDPRTGRYRASNDVGDAVMLYALSVGPLWERTRGNDDGARALVTEVVR